MMPPGFPEGCVASLAGSQRCHVLLVFPVGVGSGVDACNALLPVLYCVVLCALVALALLCVAIGDDSVGAGAGAAAGRKETGHRLRECLQL